MFGLVVYTVGALHKLKWFFPPLISYISLGMIWSVFAHDTSLPCSSKNIMKEQHTLGEQGRNKEKS